MSLVVHLVPVYLSPGLTSSTISYTLGMGSTSVKFSAHFQDDPPFENPMSHCHWLTLTQTPSRCSLNQWNETYMSLISLSVQVSNWHITAFRHAPLILRSLNLSGEWGRSTSVWVWSLKDTQHLMNIYICPLMAAIMCPLGCLSWQGSHTDSGLLGLLSNC